MSFKENVIFSRSQKLGILFTFALLSIGIAIVGIWKSSKSSKTDIEKFEVFVNKEDSLRSLPLSSESVYTIDINTADSSDWAQLPGIGEVLSKRIINYREAIGGFHTIAQLARVYGLKAEVLADIEPYLIVDPATIPKEQQQRRKRTPSFAYLSNLDVNIATQHEFEQLPGIGEVLSQRIIKFRDAKGGFEHIDELKMVYGLKPEVFENVASKLYVDSTTMPPPREWIADNTRGLNDENEVSLISDSLPMEEMSLDEVFKTIDINQATEQDLISLHGIGEKLAGRIIRYRKILGFYASVDQLQSVYGLSDKTFQRLRPLLEATPPIDYQKKDFNTSTEKLLAAYPFISQALAKNIISQRKQLGWFEDWTQLKDIEGMNENILKQLQVYFEI